MFLISPFLFNMKKCYKCKEEKQLQEFAKDKSKKDGLNSSCKICSKLMIKDYHKENKEKIKSSRKIYNENNKDKNREYWESYYALNKEVLLIKANEWYQNNKEGYLEYRKLYNCGNKDKIKQYEKLYYETNKDVVLDRGKNSEKITLTTERNGFKIINKK